jgi:hypothetical protein
VVKRLDAGGDILLSGETREEVDAALKDMVSRGADVITPLSQVGRTWVAACTQPPQPKELDRTSSLDLRELQAAQRKQRPLAKLCKVEQMGFKLVVTGPSHDAVYACVQDLLEQGATLVSDAEDDGGTWVAVLDTAGPSKPEEA